MKGTTPTFAVATIVPKHGGRHEEIYYHEQTGYQATEDEEKRYCIPQHIQHKLKVRKRRR